MYIPVDKNAIVKWEEYSLFVPVISVGNVGQLAADLIISTLAMDSIGHIFHPAVTPAVGTNPFAPLSTVDTACILTTSCEVYESRERKIMVIQQRSPLIKGRVKGYVQFLSDWIKKKKFHQVVIIGSVFSHERLDYQMQGSPFRVVMTDSFRERAGKTVEKLGWKAMEPRSGLNAGGDNLEGRNNTASLFLPGGGIAKPLLESLQDTAVLLFVMFCSEGDNVPDALSMVHELNGCITMLWKEEQPENEFKGSTAPNVQGWKMPPSWINFYGTKFDQTLFH